MKRRAIQRARTRLYRAVARHGFTIHKTVDGRVLMPKRRVRRATDKLQRVMTAAGVSTNAGAEIDRQMAELFR